MKDRFGRSIDYMRLSITDRCNLRCSYCMPNGIQQELHDDILSYEEILRVAQAAVSLGITRFKVTGGEPLVRRGCVSFLRLLKTMPGVEQVTLTTNGVLLAPIADQLADIKLDAVNISLDAADPTIYTQITGVDALDRVLEGLEASINVGLKTKLNSVLLRGCESRIVPLAQFAEHRPVDVRFIEVMPIGAGAQNPGLSSETALRILRNCWPDLHPIDGHFGNGPAHYYGSRQLTGRIGIIDAISHKFCNTCNRVRLTSTGLLKPCLCYGEGTDVRAVLRSSNSDPQMLNDVLYQAIWHKPYAHCFDDKASITEQKTMSEIGG